MHKIFIGILLTITLTGCANVPQQGTGGYDPETQALLAVATQTGAANLIRQTEAAKTETAVAIYAEQTAVSSYATATKQTEMQATAQAQAQETAVSATETAVHLPVSVQQTVEKQVLIMEREALNTSATATAVKLQINKDAAAAKRWNYFWIVFIVFLTGMGIAIVIFSINAALRFQKPVAPVFDDHGNAIVDKRYYIEPPRLRRAVVIENPEYQPQIQAPINNMDRSTRPVTWKTANGETTINVADSDQRITEHQWHTLAYAVLVDEIGFSREAVTENTWLSQGAYNAMYAKLTEWKMADTPEGEPEKLENAKCYEFLFSKLGAGDQQRVRYPHPGGLAPVFSGVNQPN